MEAVFLKLLNMSLTACVLILAVLPLRFLLKKAPRWSICLLWGLVALRLICPFTLESSLSLIRSSEPITKEVLTLEVKPEEEITVSELENPMPNNHMQEVWVDTVENSQQVPQQNGMEPITVAAYVWLFGVGVMLTYSMVSYIQLKRRVSTATKLEDNIRQSEYVTSPFVLGVFCPTIYLPYGMKQPHLDHILAHERSHIRRGDHLIKPMGFVILSVHWFNPLVWVAYILLCRDIEAACDERVIKEMTKEQRQSYSATLLRCSVHRRRIAACPVAFGENGVKQRIKGIMSYKKPMLWIVIAALLVGTAAGVCFLTERPEDPQPTEPTELVISHREQMDALLDQLLDHEDADVVSNPKKCIAQSPDVYQELLSYDDLALSYFLPKLRKADIHSYREYMMVYVCAELTGIGYINYADSTWWEIPQRWIVEYDRNVMGSNPTQRIKPGVYEPFYAIKNEENPYYGEPWEGPYDADYYVTADSLIRVYRNKLTMRWDYSHADVQTVREKVEWQWESCNGVGAPQTERAQELRKALDQSLKFLEGTDFEVLLTNENCLFQPLDRGACIMLSNDELYLVQSDYGKTGYGHIHYVVRLFDIDHHIIFEE